MQSRPVPSPLCLIGGGEHARVVADLVSTLGHHRLEGFWGPEPEAGLSHLGTDALLRAEFTSKWKECGFHLAMVGRPGGGLRRSVLAGLADLALDWRSLVHPTAFVSSTAGLEGGCFVGAKAVVHTGARLGSHVVVNTGAIVEHDVRIGQGTHLAPGAIVGGGVEIGAWSVLGLGCSVRDHVRIGNGAVVAMGAVVVADVPDGAWMAGVPARRMNGDGAYARS